MLLWPQICIGVQHWRWSHKIAVDRIPYNSKGAGPIQQLWRGSHTTITMKSVPYISSGGGLMQELWTESHIITMERSNTIAVEKVHTNTEKTVSYDSGSTQFSRVVRLSEYESAVWVWVGWLQFEPDFLLNTLGIALAMHVCMHTGWLSREGIASRYACVHAHRVTVSRGHCVSLPMCACSLGYCHERALRLATHVCMLTGLLPREGIASRYACVHAHWVTAPRGACYGQATDLPEIYDIHTSNISQRICWEQWK